MELRDYQDAAVERLMPKLEKAGRPLLVSPTGSGKSVMGAAVVLRSKARRVLWLAHRIELLRQARDELLEAGVRPEDVGIMSGVEKENEDARVLVASIDSVRGRPLPGGIGLVVVDEAHRTLAKTYLRVLGALPGVPVLGMTATPWRLDGKPLGDVYDEIVHAASHTELQAFGYLAKPIVYGVPLSKARAMVKGLQTGKGDYSQGKLGQAMMSGTLMGDVVKECARLAHGRRTIVFAASRQHGQALTTRFRAAGRRAKYLDGETPSSVRRARLAQLRSGSTEVLVNVDVLSEGFDCPPVTCIALARPTRSLTRYLQQVGRASRPFDDVKPIILDHAGNAWRFGLPDADRHDAWLLDGKVSAVPGEAPVRMCPSCGAMVHAGLRTCSVCGDEFPLNERELREREAELERIRGDEAAREHQRERLAVVAVKNGLGEDWLSSAIKALDL